mmetsp:Transcript_43214/g.74873  ORF Transcript_43214/g.74873 Transcript_43214/m.74873 type:complete len:205 (-) Transcript_43214:1558-2172(-)
MASIFSMYSWYAGIRRSRVRNPSATSSQRTWRYALCQRRTAGERFFSAAAAANGVFSASSVRMTTCSSRCISEARVDCRVSFRRSASRPATPARKSSMLEVRSRNRRAASSDSGCARGACTSRLRAPPGGASVAQGSPARCCRNGPRSCPPSWAPAPAPGAAAAAAAAWAWAGVGSCSRAVRYSAQSSPRATVSRRPCSASAAR